jgi:phosphoglycolate phosphatase
MTRLVLFDIDGTLVDSRRTIHQMMVAAFQHFGLAEPTLEAVQWIIGLDLVEGIGTLPGLNGVDPAAIADAYRAAYRPRRDAGIPDGPMFPGMFDLVEGLFAAGHVLGIATGKNREGLDRVLATQGLERFISTRQAGTPPPGKPHPAMLYRALAETGFSADQAYLVGDTTFDVEMALAAGVTPIAVSWGYHPVEALRAAGAAIVVDRAADVWDALNLPPA